MITYIVLLIIMLIYLDYSFWYNAEMHNIWHPENLQKFRGVLYKLWDFIKDAINGKNCKCVQYKPEPPKRETMKCKDCKYWQMEDEPPWISEFMECTRVDESDPNWWKKYHFRGPEDSCEYGERK